MTSHIFCWVVLSLLIIGNGIAIYIATDYPVAGFLNLGALVLTIGAGFFFKQHDEENTVSSVSVATGGSDSNNVGSGQLDFDDINTTNGEQHSDTNS
jgi:hypothetical protein